MVCPLRFVLVGVSAAVALLVAYNTTWADETEEPEEQEARGSGKTSNAAGGGSRSDWSLQMLLRVIVNMATGRYLYDLYQQRKTSAKHVKAA